MKKSAKSCSKLAIAVAAAVSTVSLTIVEQSAAAQMEKCYGVALRGQNDCSGGSHECAGRSTRDYDPGSFKWVAKGTCAAMKAQVRKHKS